MSYIVLARRYRPQSFDEVVGQKHITDLLKEGIRTKHLGHAFLFCGPRGVGKTSCARILAKSLNCKEGPTATPCDKCPACKEITSGNSFDVIEIDGASNRGIDEIRTLRENVKFAPSYGRYKIYIIDEVHMLTEPAFNALLKTLEEPPEYVKFILATTAPAKVPATIISRCQRFDFYRISIAVLTSTLESIAKTEKLKVSDEAMFAIAKAASGSLRDALSILDQAGALSRKDIKAEDITSMLGTVEIGLLFELVDCISQRNCSAALSVIDKIINQGKDMKQLNRDLIEHFRHLMIMKVGGKGLGGLVDYPVAAKEMLLIQSQAFALPEIIKAIEIFVQCQENARAADSLRIPLELAIAQLTYRVEAKGAVTSPSKASAQPKPIEGKVVSPSTEVRFTSPVNILANKKGFVGLPGGEEDLSLGLPKEIENTVIAEPLTIGTVKRSWDAVTHAISREKMSVATFLQEGSPYALQGSKLTIGFPKEATFHKEALETKDSLRIVERVFSEKLNAALKIDFKIVEDHKPQEDEPFVKAALEAFKGKVVNKWHSDTNAGK
ncbi:MAG TPA: DNA polymerase III subunit gamma/tau [Candidatus Omnitrophota bacterium]|nr:DNA polymerase III subunit gamma/tau [Candidatus Omnitrophota bacterium]HPD85676.1 DNA polymerase III subunit gamma/tau [Candidatus Omnitrophota bacterium]HRZ04519.1 DNA polymerase III subunit gamma/tau [Candidatus Omnitrophota bacterium]